MSDSAIPFASLGVPLNLEPRLARDAPTKVKRAIAKGLVPIPPGAQLGALYVLASDPDKRVAKAARKTLKGLPKKVLLGDISSRTHPKILEFIAQYRRDPELDERIGMMRSANDRTVVLIAKRANTALSDMLSRNHERLLVTPDVYVAMYGNPECPDAAVHRAEAFLRMQEQLPEVPAVRPFRASDTPAPDGADNEEDGHEDSTTADVSEEGSATDGVPTAPSAEAAGVDSASTTGPSTDAAALVRPEDIEMDVEAEVEAALAGKPSPWLVERHQARLALSEAGLLEDADADEFQFDFDDGSANLSSHLTGDHSEKSTEEKGAIKKSIDRQIKDMSVGQKIKLAYLGNKEARSYLIRDRNRIVAGAVVKSGRLTDQEVASYAANKNLDSDVIREIAKNREWIRKYPVKVALVNNPKTPVAQAVSMVSQLQKKDLLMLTRNRNVPSVVGQAANRLYRQKYKKM